MDANFIIAEFSLKLIILWTQNLTLAIDAVTVALQEIQDLPQETRDQTPQMLLARCSLAKPSLAESSLVEPSRDQLTEYD